LPIAPVGGEFGCSVRRSLGALQLPDTLQCRNSIDPCTACVGGQRQGGDSSAELRLPESVVSDLDVFLARRQCQNICRNHAFKSSPRLQFRRADADAGEPERDCWVDQHRRLPCVCGAVAEVRVCGLKSSIVQEGHLNGSVHVQRLPGDEVLHLVRDGLRLLLILDPHGLLGRRDRDCVGDRRETGITPCIFRRNTSAETDRQKQENGRLELDFHDASPLGGACNSFCFFHGF
jgi:hypothetical protein